MRSDRNVRSRLRFAVARCDRDDAGMSLIETMVGILVLTVLLGIASAAIMQMGRYVGTAQSVGDSSTEVRKAFTLMDRQVRYADAINSPTAIGTGATARWYVEFRSTADGDGDANPTCAQWRLDAAADRLEYRSWEVVNGAAVPASPTWAVAARNIANDPTNATELPFGWASAGQAFADEPASTVTTRQRLRFQVISAVGARDRQRTVSAVDFTARNSSSTSPTRDAGTDGVSDSFVCTEVGRP
jgi:Tfp pilus assembly protein PilV